MIKNIIKKIAPKAKDWPEVYSLQSVLIDWYRRNARRLPWRENGDAYRIWISETMLQQTTVKAVVPYFQRFMSQFPTLNRLALASEGQVLASWSGLGYYRRARQLHRAARLFIEKGFPTHHSELLKFPGFGPYTARAVASLAFNQPVGVVDGNVIRVLCRLFQIDSPWWKSSVKNNLQKIADEMVGGVSSRDMNQAMMELGATICTPLPHCTICPVLSFCKALKTRNVETLPLKKPRRETQIWLWRPIIEIRKNKIALIRNHYAPFLKGQWLPPGSAQLKTKAPLHYDFKHRITHHEIFVKSQTKKARPMKLAIPHQIGPSYQKIRRLYWCPLIKLNEVSPASLVEKTIKHTRLLTVCLAFLLFACSESCSHGPKSMGPRPSQKAIVPPENYQVPNATMIDLKGQNRSPSFSLDGQRILYVSSDRAEHQQSQVYEVDLKTLKERRVTHHDGNDGSPKYSFTANELFYVSATDELKENPKLFTNSLRQVVPSSRMIQGSQSGSTQPPSEIAAQSSFENKYENEAGAEIYSSQLNGSRIKRITQEPGFDGQISVHPSGRFLAFVTQRTKRSQIWRLDLKQMHMLEMTKTKTDEMSPSYSPDGKSLVWVHLPKGVQRRPASQPPMEATFSKSQVYVLESGKVRPREVFETQATIQSPSWHPEGGIIIFSSNFDDPNNFELYTLNLKDQCLKRLTFDYGHNIDGSFSPDGKTILFSSNESGEFKIYAMPYSPPTTCLTLGLPQKQ